MTESAVKPGQMQASNVTGGTGTAAKRGGGAYQGSCKSFNQEKGFGFVVGADGTDIFYHVKAVSDGTTPQAGDMLSYDLEPSPMKPDQMQATNVTGGTGWGKGGGKGGKGGDAWGGKGGDSWGGKGGGKGGWGGGDDSWGAAPYGSGKGKGKDGGKGASWGGDDGWGSGGGKGGKSWGGGGW